MTFSKHVLRGVALAALTLGLTLPAAAQNGTNYVVHSNGLDAIFLGVGAGGAQVAGADGIGWWVDGTDLVGNTVTALGDHGYKQVTFGMSVCVLGPPIPGLRLDFPLITVVEYDHYNVGWLPIFTLDVLCGVGGVPAGVTTGGTVPFGLAPGTSANFLISPLPTGVGAPSSTLVLIPENGLLNHTATATIIAAGAGNLMINSTGFCWVVTFTWLPSALLGVDKIDGWWYWAANSRSGNQYWGISTDEMNLLQTRTVGTDAGLTALYAFVSSADYEFHDSTQPSSVNDSLHPGGHNGAGPYYTTAAGPTCTTLASIIPNGGFDMGRHLGWSFSGAGGAFDNPVTGLSNQNPAGAALPLPFGVTLGFTSWNNQNYPILTNPTAPSSGGTRIVWIQINWVFVLRLVWTEATNPTAIGDATFTQRVPCGVEFLGPDPWPQALTLDNLLTWAHDTCNAAGDPAYPDPWGFPGGAFLIPPVMGTSNIHAPLPPLAFCIFGVKVMFCYGTVGTVSTTPPNAFTKPGFQDLTWNPGVATVGNSHTRIAYD